MNRIMLAIITMVSFLTAVSCGVQAVPYQGIDLGTIGGESSLALSINNRGQVVGYSSTSDGHDHAFLWDSVRGMRDLGTLGGMVSVARSINNLGYVTGYSYTADGSRHTFVWNEEYGMQDLGTLGGSNSEAEAINNDGRILGFSEVTGDDLLHTFFWDTTSGMVDIGSGVMAYGINDLDHIVGRVDDSAFVWDRVTGTRRIEPAGSVWSEAASINNLHQVAGTARSPDNSTYAFLWDSTYGVHDLGTLGGASSASYINNVGQVVGSSTAVDGSSRAFVWDSTNGILPLDSHGVRSGATGVNDLGWIVGSYTDASGKTNAIMWTPVPEPSSILVLLCGLSAVRMLMKRNKE